MHLERAVARHLLLAGVRTDSSDALLTRLIDQCESAGALPDVVTLARAHGVAQLLSFRMTQIESFGRRYPGWLDSDRGVAQAQHLQAVRILRSVARTVDRPFLAFKGPTLARWYGESGLRRFSDVDLLVRRRDFVSVFECLVASGFEELSSNWVGFREHEVAEVPLGRERVCIDLHWHLIATGGTRRQFRLDVPAMIDRAESVRVGGVEVLTLDRLDTLLHLCLGAGLDGGRRLLQLVDIDRLIRSGGIDWGEFARRADEAGGRAVSVAVIDRCRRLLGTPVPPDVQKDLAPYPGWRLVNSVIGERRNATSGLRRGVGTGVLLSLGRDSPSATLHAIGGALPGLAREKLTGSTAAQAGGPLDWQRRSPVPARDRARYLDWVADGAAVRLLRCRDANDLYRMLKAEQPRSMPLLGAALARGLHRSGRRGYVCLDEKGDCLGAVVLRRWMPLHWAAHVVVLDLAAAPSLGRLLDASVAMTLQGFAPDVEAVRPFLSRWRDGQEMAAAALPPGFGWPEAPPDVRRATRTDVAAITELAWREAPHSLRSRWLLKRRITQAVAEGLLVVESGKPNRIGGYVALENRTPEYDQWAHLVVDPACRGRGLSWDLVAGALTLTRNRGAGAFVTVLATNPMVVPPEAALPDPFVHVSLRARPRNPLKRLSRRRGRGNALS